MKITATQIQSVLCALDNANNSAMGRAYGHLVQLNEYNDSISNGLSVLAEKSYRRKRNFSKFLGFARQVVEFGYTFIIYQILKTKENYNNAL